MSSGAHVDTQSPHHGSHLASSSRRSSHLEHILIPTASEDSHPLSGDSSNFHSDHSQETYSADSMSAGGHQPGIGHYQQSQRMNEKARGRERTRDVIGGDVEQMIVSQLNSNVETPSRKRRRSRKGLDKKFECPEDGCGRSYSRAEHLYRHQLNRKAFP